MSDDADTVQAAAKAAAKAANEKMFNKMDLSNAIAEKTGLPRPKANAVIDATLAIMTEQLAQGIEVRFGGFGIFGVAERKAGKGRDPRTGAEIDIPASRTVRFRPSKGLREAVADKVAEDDAA
jgi:DNA-binding protein HU-beta